jgi:2-phosphosulfolactate phosphatase
MVTAEPNRSRLLSNSLDQITLVAMGENRLKRTDEVQLCAIHLRNRLEGKSGDMNAVRRLILAGSEVGRFHDPARPYLHPAPLSTSILRSISIATISPRGRV